MERVPHQNFFEIGKLADALGSEHAATVDHRDASRIITAVLKAAQAVDQHADDVTRSYVAHNPTHS
jgi:hypothetical protein